MTDIVDAIDALVDEQLAGYSKRSGYDFNVGQDRCPHCPETWHGLRITQRMQDMRCQEAFDEDYRYNQDDSPVICPGSDFIGPWATPQQLEWIRSGDTATPMERIERWIRSNYDDGRPLHGSLGLFQQSSGTWGAATGPLTHDVIRVEPGGRRTLMRGEIQSRASNPPRATQVRVGGRRNGRATRTAFERLRGLRVHGTCETPAGGDSIPGYFRDALMEKFVREAHLLYRGHSDHVLLNFAPGDLQMSGMTNTTTRTTRVDVWWRPPTNTVVLEGWENNQGGVFEVQDINTPINVDVAPSPASYMFATDTGPVEPIPIATYELSGWDWRERRWMFSRL